MLSRPIALLAAPDISPHPVLLHAARTLLAFLRSVPEIIKGIIFVAAVGRLGGDAADAFEMADWALEVRPRAILPALLAHPARMVTPHLGSATLAARRAIELRAAANIVDVLGCGSARDALWRGVTC
jgi:hypothetical protein